MEIYSPYYALWDYIIVSLWDMDTLMNAIVMHVAPALLSLSDELDCELDHALYIEQGCGPGDYHNYDNY